MLRKLKVDSDLDINRLESIRDAHTGKKGKEYRTDRMEDYLEVIYELVQQKGYATTIDISQYLNVSSPSVTFLLYQFIDNFKIIFHSICTVFVFLLSGMSITNGFKTIDTCLRVTFQIS